LTRPCRTAPERRGRPPRSPSRPAPRRPAKTSAARGSDADIAGEVEPAGHFRIYLGGRTSPSAGGSYGGFSRRPVPPASTSSSWPAGSFSRRKPPTRVPPTSPDRRAGHVARAAAGFAVALQREFPCEPGGPPGPQPGGPGPMALPGQGTGSYDRWHDSAWTCVPGRERRVYLAHGTRSRAQVNYCRGRLAGSRSRLGCPSRKR
jgi:hypothetical protein